MHHSGGTIGVSNELALVPEENLAVAILSNTLSQWPEAILIRILRTLLPDKLKDFPKPTDQAVKEPPFVPDKKLIGPWGRACSHLRERDSPCIRYQSIRQYIHHDG